MIVSKNCYLTQMPFKIDRKEVVVSVTTLVNTGDVEVLSSVFSLNTRAVTLTAFPFQCMVV